MPDDLPAFSAQRRLDQPVTDTLRVRPNMTLTLEKIDHGDLCHGWSWTVTNEDELAERVARIALGQYRHVAKILSGAGVPGPTATAEQPKAEIKLLTRGKNEEPWHRDGWIFQAISWIAANQAPSGSLTRAPHIRRADKGFDGLQLQLSDDGKVVTAVIVLLRDCAPVKGIQPNGGCQNPCCSKENLVMDADGDAA